MALGALGTKVWIVTGMTLAKNCSDGAPLKRVLRCMTLTASLLVFVIATTRTLDPVRNCRLSGVINSLTLALLLNVPL